MNLTELQTILLDWHPKPRRKPISHYDVAAGVIYKSVVCFMYAKDDSLNLITTLTNHAIPAGSISVSKVNEDVSWQYDTYFYQSVWRDGQKMPLTMRLYRSPLTFWQTKDPQKPERVWAVLRRLRLDSFPAPHLLARGKFENTQYIIWHQLPERRRQNIPISSAENLKPIVPQLAELLARLHSLNHNGLNNEPLYQATVAGTLVRMLLWSREMGNEDLRGVISRLKPTIAGMKSWRHKLIHGEPTLDNITLAGGKVTTLLNWENAAIGDPRWDVMTAAHALRPAVPALADQLVNWYETFTGKTIDQRPFWYAFISVRTWALKAWLSHAIESGSAAADAIDWTKDLPEARARAFQDLANAGV